MREPKYIVVTFGQLKKMIAEAIHVSEPNPSDAWKKLPPGEEDEEEEEKK